MDPEPSPPNPPPAAPAVARRFTRLRRSLLLIGAVMLLMLAVLRYFSPGISDYATARSIELQVSEARLAPDGTMTGLLQLHYDRSRLPFYLRPFVWPTIQ